MAPEFGQLFDHLPLIPEGVLRQHKVHQPRDTRFRAAARLLQALWREDCGLPVGTFACADGKTKKLGSRITEAAGRAGQNFVTPEIAALAQREACYREIGAMIDEERLFTNLLSSMPLTFNLLGPLRLDPRLATAVVTALIPGFDGSVKQVLFEHSPSRSNPAFTDDRTAFDALIRYGKPNGQRGFVAFEVKYSECCTEPAPPIKDRYAELSRETGLFIDPDAAYLRVNPLQQLWREHCLAQAMVKNGLYDEGTFVLVAPRLNRDCQNAAGAYACQLAEPHGDQVGFMNWHLEDVVEAIRSAGAGVYAQQLHRRYCDFWLVDGEIELALDARRARTKSKGQRAVENGETKTPAPLPGARKAPADRAST